jgi:Fuc2NAc and GlcNAc transferase
MKDILQSNDWLIKIILFILVGALSFIATFYYRRFAVSKSIIAKINFRTLHNKVIPRGGGIAFASIFSLLIFSIWLIGACDTWLMLTLAVGGIAASILGFIDDIYEVSTLKKLIAQFCLSLYFFIIFFSYHPFPFDLSKDLLLSVMVIAFWLFVPLWFINLFNFVDGVDGMAVSASVFACICAIILLILRDGDATMIFVFALLAAICIGFSFFNMPPASIFMGDAGSIFLGYCIGILLLITVYLGEISIWNWMISLSYFLADTTTTTITRMFLVKKWYGVHRSHAYQNLARIKKNHAKVTYGVLLYNLLWVLPLLLWSSFKPGWAPVAAFLSLLPAVIWSLRFGPLLSRD